MLNQLKIRYIIIKCLKIRSLFLKKNLLRGLESTGKKKVTTEEAIREQVLPSEEMVLVRVVQLLGYDRIFVKCNDGNT